jgi:hypothetical protein
MLAHSPVTWDYTETLKINYYGSKEVCFLPQEKFQECHIVPWELSKGVLGAVIYTTQLTDSKPDIDSSCSTVVNEVVEQFQDIFAEPTKLPPQRDCDH